jgi:hypothetical protein
MRRLRADYGASPLHLLAAVASFAIATYAFLEIVARPDALNTLIWFGAAILAHDLIAFPLYSLLGWIAGGPFRIPPRGPEDPIRSMALNHLRVPAILSAFALVAWFPLVLGLSAERYQQKTAMTETAFLGRWLLLTGALFAVSAIALAFRVRLLRRRTAAADGGEPAVNPQG